MLNIITPSLTQYLIDQIIVKKQIYLFSHFILEVVIILLTGSICGLISNYLLVNSFEKISKNMKYSLFKVLYYRNIDFFSINKSGEINYRIFNDTDIIQSSLLTFTINVPINIVIIIIVAFLMFQINVALSIFVFCVLVLLSLLTKFTQKPIVKLTKQQRERAQIANGGITEFIKSIRLIRGMGLKLLSFNRVDHQLNSLKSANIKITTFSKWISVIFSIINNGWSLIVLWYGGQLIIGSHITLGALIAFIMYANILYPQFTSIFNAIITFQQVKVSADRYVEYYVNNEKQAYINNLPAFTLDKGYITFENVDFAYDGGKLILDNFTYAFKPNKITLIKGKNGSGKTTICSLIKRFYKVNFGNIKIDNVNVRDYNQDEIDRNIKYLPQDQFIISGSVYDNLLTDYSKANKNDMLLALETVGLRQYIENLPDGLNTQMGESGSMFSGGQCQRIALARLLLCKPKIIMLDEPIAFLDSATKFLIYNCLKALKSSSTIIVVIHSDSFSDISDDVLNLDNI